MITALLQFYHCPTAVTSLPASFLRCVEKFVGLFVLRAFATAMPLSIAQAANLCSTTTTLAILPTISLVDVRRLDPLSTSTCWTIDPVLCGELLELAIPSLLEFDIEKFVDVFEGNMVGCAAFRRHMLRISY